MGIVVSVIAGIEISEAVAGAVAVGEGVALAVEAGEAVATVAEITATAIESAELAVAGAEALTVGAEVAEVAEITDIAMTTEELLAEADGLTAEYEEMFGAVDASENTGTALITEVDSAIADTETLLAGIEESEALEAFEGLEEASLLDMEEQFGLNDVIKFVKEYGMDIFNTLSTVNAIYQETKKILDLLSDADKKPVKSVTDLIFLDPNGNVVDVSHLLGNTFQYLDAYALGYNTAKILTRAIERFHINAKDMSTRNMEEQLLVAILESARDLPQYNQTIGDGTIAKKLYTYLRNTEAFKNPEIIDLEYSKIKQIYDGSISEPFYDENGHPSIIDELGIKRSWDNDNMSLKVKGKIINIPSLHGEYVGALSSNQKLPIDLVDSFALLHDLSYVDSSFNRVGDLQFVSRLTQNFHRMSGKQLMVAKFSARWFASAGTILQSLTEDKVLTNTIAGTSNFYNYIVPQSVNFKFSGRERKGIGAIRAGGELNFRSGLSEGMQEGFLDAGQNTGISTTSSNNTELLQMLGNLKAVKMCR